MTPELVSVVAPVFNEAETVDEFVARLTSAADQLRGQYAFEFILVDDGSTDGSLERMKALLDRETRLRILELRRNYGQTAALQAGLDECRGEIVITLDADLQHFPEEIPLFLAKLEEGFDMVCGWRKERAEGRVRRWPSLVANALLRRVSGLSIHDFGTTFRAYRHSIAAELKLRGDFHRFIPALGKDLGARVCEIPIRNIERPKGASKYGLGRTLGVFLDLLLLFLMFRYMERPMRIFGKVGLLCLGAGTTIWVVLVAYACATGVHAVIERQGWLILGLALIIVAVQLILTGFLAEMITRGHGSGGARPSYRLRHVWPKDIRSE